MKGFATYRCCHPCFKIIPITIPGDLPTDPNGIQAFIKLNINRNFNNTNKTKHIIFKNENLFPFQLSANYV